MKTRSESLKIAASQTYDLVVIGGGIAGAGVAQDAAARGLSVLLIEKDDFASGTSSRTTKLIHGGLRYLEQFHFALTRQLCQERALLETLAPHMVREFNFVMPLTPDNPWFGLKAQLGLTIYDLLSLTVNSRRFHQRLGQDEVLKAAPCLSPAVVSAGLRFWDCITDDARLVLEVIKSACQKRAVAVNYLEVVGFNTLDGKINGVKCHDRFSGQELEISCRMCVNATGVWTDQLCQLLNSNWGSHVKPSKGIHIIVPASALQTNAALFLPTQDGRYVFVIPWQRALMIGTTDSAYSGQLNAPLPDADEIDYLLSVVNRYCPDKKLNAGDITGSFAGLRPLLSLPGSAQSTTNMSREHAIYQGPGGLWNVTGGKLTNFRVMAAEVVDRLYECIPHKEFVPSTTSHLMLGGWSDKSNFMAASAAILSRARALALEPATVDHLLSTYGLDAAKILDLVEGDDSLKARICPDFPPIMAEVPFCLVEEMVVSLEDLLLRRLRLGLLHQKQCWQAAPKVAAVMQKLCNWDKLRLELELNALECALQQNLNSAGTGMV